MGGAPQEWFVTCSEQNLPPQLEHVEVTRTPQTLHAEGLRLLKYASRFLSPDVSSPLRHQVEVFDWFLVRRKENMLLSFLATSIVIDGSVMPLLVRISSVGHC